jgi:hypothetical protein
MPPPSGLRTVGNDPPPPHGHQAPDGFHQPEGPCALQEAVGGAKPAGRGEREDEPTAAILQGVEDQHRRDREQSKGGEQVQLYVTFFADVTWLLVTDVARYCP